MDSPPCLLIVSDGTKKVEFLSGGSQKEITMLFRRLKTHLFRVNLRIAESAMQTALFVLGTLVL